MVHHSIITSGILTCGTSDISILLTKAIPSDISKGYLTTNNVARGRRKESGEQNNNCSKTEFENEIMVRRKGCHAWDLDGISYQAGEYTRSSLEQNQWAVVKSRWGNELSSVSGREHMTNEFIIITIKILGYPCKP